MCTGRRGLPLFTSCREFASLERSPVVCLDGLMAHRSDFIREVQYLAGLMRRDCRDALWRVEHLSLKLEEGESLNTSGTAVQLTHANEELQRALQSIERLEKHCEQELGG